MIKKWTMYVGLFISIALITTGCATSTYQFQPLDRETAGWWTLYLVLPLSDALDFFNHYFNSYGLSILAVTLLIRALMWPFVIKQQQHLKASQRIQPELNKIKEKYKKDPQKRQMETVKLLQENNANPLVGCLSFLVQAILMINLNWAIGGNPQIHNAEFLYMSLGDPDPYYILPILTAITAYLQGTVTSSLNGNGNPQLDIASKVLPIFSIFITVMLPSGTVLYWIYANIFGIIQSMIMNRFYNQNQELDGEGSLNPLSRK